LLVVELEGAALPAAAEQADIKLDLLIDLLAQLQSQ
jgi:hypothetical protein